MASQQEIDEILAVADQYLGGRERALKAREEQFGEIAKRILDVEQVVVSVLRDTNHHATAAYVQARLKSIRQKIKSDIDLIDPATR